ncbi:MAG: hypothetical protein CL693_10475 [Cellvibrionaceae bacterium]|nr:hypothetical protein [Cellvibrionaceae bacterium]|tara:strand:- start:22906 stop:23817 length:912 start_codon:yes stop_codon:yes gene_type:complete
MNPEPQITVRSWKQDPLTHFLVAGAVLFLALSWIAPEKENQRTIVVDRDALLTFTQYRTKVFQPEMAAKHLDSLSDDDRQKLIRQYVEEEALYREAIAMGLEGDDYIIRRRMVQKLEFITQGFVEQELVIDEEALAAFFEEHKAEYYIEPSITFTHVYLSYDKHIKAGGTQDSFVDVAQKQLKQLHDDRVSFSQSVGYGDRFPFHVNYVEKTPEFVASHFGESFSDELFGLASDGESVLNWVGPFRSQYGLHLVNVSQRLEGRSPELEDVRAMVAQDYRQAKILEHQRQAVGDIVKQYKVVER